MLAFIITKYIVKRVEDEGLGFRDGPQFEDMKYWIEERTKRLGTKRGRIIHKIFYQEDLLVVILGNVEVEDIENGFRLLVQEGKGRK